MTQDELNAQSPRARGYRFPAEWEPHEATWLAWPHNREDWPGKFRPIPWVYAEIVRVLSQFEPVRIVVESREQRDEIRRKLQRGGARMDRVEFFRASTDRVWLRDSGPMFVVNELAETAEAAVALIDWRFNAWAKYDNHRHDDKLPRRIARWLERDHSWTRWTPRLEIDGEPRRIVLEGGAIDANGLGSLLTTEECLLSPIQERNPGLDRAGYEQVLAEYLAATHVIWLDRGIVGDDTHGHVDDLARFVNPTTVAIVQERDANDENHRALAENWRRLSQATDQDGVPLTLAPLPMPRPVMFDGARLPASYANFYIANGVVIVPTFNDPADREALSIIAQLFPGREVVGIHAVDLVWGLGTLHCLSREQPRGVTQSGQDNEKFSNFDAVRPTVTDQ